MERENTVGLSLTNGSECICNPEILFGTKFGLWDFKNQVAPRGTLLDLNAAWEILLSKQEFVNDVRFVEEYHPTAGIDDKGISYGAGDTVYTLTDEQGNKTNASFVIKANKGPVEHIEWQDGNLILYYTKTRKITPEDNQYPVHYVYDSDGQVVTEDGVPLIYDYVVVPVLEIFDNEETHKLFPWFADDNHVVRLRQTLDDDNNHLGDVAITPESEVFIAKERYAENQGNTLVSLQSIYQQLQQDLGITPQYTTDNTIVDEEGASIHQRVTGSNLEFTLRTENTESLVKAINSLKNNYDNLHKMVDGHAEIIEDPNTHLEFAQYLLTNQYPFKYIYSQSEPFNRNNDQLESSSRNLLWALNNLQHYDLGDFQQKINSDIFSENDSKNITKALNNIFDGVLSNKEKIGWNPTTKQWFELTTDAQILINAINEVNSHADELRDIVGVQEETPHFTNTSLHQLIKNRSRSTDKNRVQIVESLNILQDEIGELESLSTDSKSNLVESINEVDLHSDNNNAAIGAVYNTNGLGQKTGDITNLNTTSKNTIVDAINELDERVGNLSELDTEDQESLVDSVNEVIANQPFVYQNVSNSDSGVTLKEHNNQAGDLSLVVGKNNSSGKESLISGEGNNSIGNFNLISGKDNTSNDNYSTVLGTSNENKGQYNLISGNTNKVTGDYNLVHGKNNNLKESNYSTVIGDSNVVNCDNVTIIGKEIQVAKNTNNSIALGISLGVNGSDSITLGNNNSSQKESIVIGNNNNDQGESNVSIGKNNSNNGQFNYQLGDNLVSTGNRNVSLGKSNSITGNNNVAIGQNQTITANGSFSIGNSNQTVNKDGAVVINGINEVHQNSTHIGKDIYVQTHDTESKLQKLIFVDLNDWCKQNNAASLNSDRFLSTSHVVQALKVYLAKNYTDNAMLRFMMLTDNEIGYIIVQGKSIRIYLNGTWYYTNNINNGWSRQDGNYLKVIKKVITTQTGDTVNKYYLAFMDQLSNNLTVDTVGAQRSNTEDFGEIDLTKAYGAVDIDDLDEALELSKKLNTKVDKSASIITVKDNGDGTTTEIYHNFVDTQDSSKSSNIVLDLKTDFGFDATVLQKRSERGQANGYVPLNSGALIDSKYLPSYVDDVVDVWAEYNVDSLTGAVVDIHLYELTSTVVPTTGQEVAAKGPEIMSGEQGKIYVEANPSSERQFGAQFRWTGSQWVAIGFSNIVIGELEGTAYDGAKGKALEESLQDHLNSGTTQIPVTENEETTYVTYKPNPHHVTLEQLDITVNDPNDPTNEQLVDPYLRNYNGKQAIQVLFDRLNTNEDKTNSSMAIIGTVQEIEQFDELDDITGNDTPTIIGELLSYEAISDDDINNIVTNNLKFYGE